MRRIWQWARERVWRLAKALLAELVFQKARCWFSVMLGGGSIGAMLAAGFMAFSLLGAWILMH